MPTTIRDEGFPEFLGGGKTDDVRSQFIRKPLEAAQEAAFSTAIETLDFLASLPEAMALSRERELRRMAEAGREDDPRLAAGARLVEQAKHVQKAATLGQARLRRVITALNGERLAFHGFVSGQDLTPLPGMTVQILIESEGREDLKATTDDDGYFSIPIGKRRREGTPATGESNSGERGSAGVTLGDATRAATVEILDRKGRVVHRDPTELSLTGRRGAYREYFLDGKDTPR